MPCTSAPTADPEGQENMRMHIRGGIVKPPSTPAPRRPRSTLTLSAHTLRSRREASTPPPSRTHARTHRAPDEALDVNEAQEVGVADVLAGNVACAAVSGRVREEE